MPLHLSKPILYLITRGASTDRTAENSPEFHDILRLISTAVSAGIDLVQIREKNMTARALFQLTECAARLTEGSTTRLLINDRADIAAAAGADGVHLTAQSLKPNIVRKSFGEEFLIGVSTHSLAEAAAARDGGADFAVLGPVFATDSKTNYGSPLGLDAFSEIC